MKALTIRQPWAGLIAQGKKTVEVRSWATKYRGPLLITASAKGPPRLPTGCTICIVDLLDCRPITVADLPHALCDACEADFAWVLANPRQVARLPVRGKLSTWTPPPELLAAL